MLHLSQPTVSGQIKALEEELGVELFRRNPKGVTLTACGHDLLNLAERILAAGNEFVDRARRHAGQLRGKIRLGTIIHPEFLRLGKLMSIVREQYPKIDIELHHGLSGWVMHCVEKKELDAGFYVGTARRPNIAAIYLRRLDFCVIAPLDWRERIDSVGWRDIAKLPWIWTPKSGAYHQLASKLFRRHGVKPTIVMEADRESTIMNLVAAGVGLSLMREDAVSSDQNATRVVLWPRGRITASLSFIFPADRQNDQALKAVVHVMQKVWGGHP